MSAPLKHVVSAPEDWQCDMRFMRTHLAPSVQQKTAQLLRDTPAMQARVAALFAAQPLIDAYDASVHAHMMAHVQALQHTHDTLVVIGTGGASLGAQALCALADDPARVLFLENCDPHSMAQFFARLSPARTAWLIISKSGETVETLAASLALEAWLAACSETLGTHVRVMTSPGARPLRLWAEHHAIAVLEHPPQLGGRFSVFSPVGFMPAAFAGLDVRALHEAAKASLKSAPQDGHEVAAMFAASIPEQPVHVVMAYADRLRPYTQWYKQLWAESLGKNGRGPTPMTAIGAIDQHSQLQLFLDGPHDKCFTVIVPEDTGTPLHLAAPSVLGMQYLHNHSMQDVMRETAAATIATLAEHRVPLRVLRGALTPTTLASLMMRTLCETLMVAAYLDIDPYSQPAVESGKIRTRNALAGEAPHG
jgi:glucose-6-phosphate isomerase